MTHVTCRLTAKNRDQLQNPTPGNRVWASFTFYMFVNAPSHSHSRLRRVDTSSVYGTVTRRRCLVSVQVLCVITMPVSLIIESHQDATYTFVSVSILLCNFLSMGLIFIPKVK